MTLGIVIAIIVVVIILWFIATYNKLVGLRNKKDDQWSQIEVQLKRRADLIPNLVETVKGYATVTTDNSSVQFHGGKAKYALYPVWLLNTTWNGNKYTFAMNGQTGKFVGDLPVDKAAARRWKLILTAAFSAAVYAAAWLLWFLDIL